MGAAQSQSTVRPVGWFDVPTTTEAWALGGLEEASKEAIREISKLPVSDFLSVEALHPQLLPDSWPFEVCPTLVA